MPSPCGIEVPPETDDRYDLMRGLCELMCARPGYLEAEARAKGNIKEYSRNNRIARMLKITADAYKFPLAQVPIKQLRNRLRLSGIKVDDGAQAKWDAAWDANEMTIWDHKLKTTMLTYGDAYLHIWKPEEDDGETDDDILQAGVIYTVHTPLTTRVIYDEDNLRNELFAINHRKEGDYEYAYLVYRDVIKYYRTTVPNRAGRKAEDWMPFTPTERIDVDGKITEVNAADGPVVENPWGEIFIKHARTEVPYGLPVHYDGYGALSGIAKLLITQICTIDTQGWPLRLALTEESLDNAQEQPDWEEDADAGATATRPAKAVQRSSLRSEPGSISVLEGIKNVLQLSPADPKVFTDPVELYVSLLSTLTETPFYSFKPGGEQPSGRAREIADAPAEAHKEIVQALLASFYKSVAKLACRIMDTSTKTVEVKWKPSVLASDTDDWQVVKAKIDAGVPFMTALGEAGYENDTMEKWFEEDQKFSPQETLDMLNTLSQVIHALEGSVGTVVDEKTVHGILEAGLKPLGIQAGSVPEKQPAPTMVPGDPRGIPNGQPDNPAGVAGTRVPPADGPVANPGRTRDQGQGAPGAQGRGTAGPVGSPSAG